MFYKNKIILVFTFSVLVLGTITLVGFFWLRTSLPITDGFIEVDGLTSPVSIIRDIYGIPHITGESQTHVYFGLGFVHAQDRMWQMETARRAGAGRLSEIFGKRTLKLDKYLMYNIILNSTVYCVCIYQLYLEPVVFCLSPSVRGVPAVRSNHKKNNLST